MPTPRILRTFTFRLAAGYACLFAISVLAILAFVFLTTGAVIERETNRAIVTEIAELSSLYRQGGIDRLTANLVQRSRSMRGLRNIYLLADPTLKPLAGNLTHWPEGKPDEEGWIDFKISDPTEDPQFLRPSTARAKTFVLRGGLHLLVGRDRSEWDRIRDIIAGSVLGAVVITLALGLGGGWVMSRSTLRRIDAINRTSGEILAGDLDRRIPDGGGRDEFDQLGRNLNAMLDRIQALVTAMREVTQNIAHDLRSPLNRVRNRLEAALRDNGGQGNGGQGNGGQGSGGTVTDNGSREVLLQTVADLDGVIDTFNALLSIAQIEAGNVEDPMVDVSLAALAEDAAELYAPLAEEQGIEVATRLDRELVVRGNRHLLAQALANLLDNAIKYTPAGGRVAVEVAQGKDREKDRVRLAVADSGPGIPEAERRNVLGRFVRLERHRQSPGTGLGLSLVAAVADLHNAELVLDDNRPGLLVTLTFPAAKGADGGNGRRR